MRPKLAWLLTIGFVLGLAFLLNRPGTGQAGSSSLLFNISPGHSASGKLSPALAASTPSCYTWDFLNDTGQDADGLVINLKGIPSVSDVYTGVNNPFGAPISGAYITSTDVYSLTFGNGSVPDSGMAQMGICASQPALRLATQPAFYWTVSGNPASPGPLFAGLDFNWVDSNHLQVHLYNQQSITLTAYSFSVLLPSSPLTLDDLNDGIASTLPMASDQVSDPLVLPGGASKTFDITFKDGGEQVAFGAPILLEAVLSTQDDPGDAIHLIAQTTQPFSQLYLPVIGK